jgi:hypothetical protein
MSQVHVESVADHPTLMLRTDLRELLDTTTFAAILSPW